VQDQLYRSHDAITGLVKKQILKDIARKWGWINHAHSKLNAISRTEAIVTLYTSKTFF